ncbi:hypothetical protein MSG28_010403 [Choristoneura fumiferana]|uniref:Uncharacterized protein n=1 Tax=Choristoneura fumiferana TaxID=7141 RepID=A0ACC0KL24_CHOFU|nr:hypothetical protein MSG28_010403 [Choristoneura fumiferana]
MKENKQVDIEETCKTVPCLIKCCAESRILFGVNTDAEDKYYCVNTSHLEKIHNVSNLEDYSDLEIYNKDIKREIIKTEKNISSFAILHYEDFTLCESESILSFFLPYLLERLGLAPFLGRLPPPSRPPASTQGGVIAARGRYRSLWKRLL